MGRGGAVNIRFLVVLAILLSGVFMMSGARGIIEAEPFSEGWSKTYGGQSNDIAHALVQTSDGGYALAGQTNSFGAGLSDVWLVKTDANGNMEWNQTYGGANDDWAEALVQTNNGGYAVAGSTSSYGVGGNDFWLVKIDAAGNMEWNKTYGGTADEVTEALIQTDDGGYALVGPTQSFGAGNYDFWLVKTDASGNASWNRTFGGINMEWAECLVETGDGGYAAAGATWSFGAGNADVWLVKTDALGNEEWNKTYGGLRDDMAHALIQTGDGGYAIASYSESIGAGMSDFWLVKTDADGNIEWNKTYGGASSDWPQAIVQADDGGYAMVGYTESYGAGESDSWLIKTDASGNALWNETYGGARLDWGESLSQTLDGNYVMAGRTASFGAGDYDFWLVKTNASDAVFEFPSFPILPLFMVTLVAIIYRRNAEPQKTAPA